MNDRRTNTGPAMFTVQIRHKLSLWYGDTNLLQGFAAVIYRREVKTRAAGVKLHRAKIKGP